MNVMRIAACGLCLAVGLSASAASDKAIVVGIADVCATNALSQVKTDYADAVYAAGAVPYLLPATTNAEAIAALVDRIDMLLLPGGVDVEPSRYGETNRMNICKVNVRRDAWEFALLDEVVRRRLPVLGICRGCQLLNVKFGGTLWQDVPSELTGAKQHRIPGEHAIAVVEGSCMSRLVGASNCSVNSRHHQAVKRLADGFKVVATSGDGVVEAIEGVDYPAVGVQFHPERMFVESGRREFLPLFRGCFAALEPKVRQKAPGRFKSVVLPDYCPTNRFVCCKSNMADALIMAGFVPLIVPFTPDDGVLDVTLAGVDALMVGGGIGPLQDYAKRCDFEHRMIRMALMRSLPISGVCHGSQIINTYFGGTLKLTPQKAGEEDFLIAHRMPVRTPFTDNFHLVDLVPGSRIASVLGSTRAVVNSSHSNRSFEMGRGLRVTARAQDGVVEAFEHESLPVMAFQFHPERMAYDARFIALLKESLSESRKCSTLQERTE